MDIWIWLVVAVLLGVAEAFSLTLITVWFVIGALVAFAVGFFGASLSIQIVVFGLVSIASLVLFRPLALKHRNQGAVNESTPVGSDALVIERLDTSAQTGRVKTSDGVTWTAISASGEVIDTGETVRIVGTSSIKLIVERI